MERELVFVALLLGASLFAVVPRGAGLRRTIPTVLGCLLAGGIVVAGIYALVPLDRPIPEAAILDRPIRTPDDGYVSANACKACHPREHATWTASFHRTMTTVATPETVSSPWDGTVESMGESYRLEREGDEFWVELDDPNQADAAPRRRVRRQVTMTTGSHHMQTYWYPTGNTRQMGQLPLMYLIEEDRFIPRVAAFLVPPSVRSASEDGRWNQTCQKCHATRGRQRRFGPNEYDTSVADFGISCEACHGPGEEHVRANRDPTRRYSYHLDDRPDPTIVQPGRLSAQRASDVCGQCHGVHYFRTTADMAGWNQNGLAYRPGDELSFFKVVARHGTSLPTTEEVQRVNPGYDPADRFWSDGMVRVSGREYNGLIESPCYGGGEFSCLSCHRMHLDEDDPRPIDDWTDDQLANAGESDRDCLQCHEQLGGEALETHTRHAAGSDGSRCYNCHMPYTTYGLLKAIRSHTVDSPSVEASLHTGRPNACNQCHLDRTLAWTADRLQEWYGIPRPELGIDQQQVAASLLWLLRGDAGQRALMAWSMGWGPALAASGSEGSTGSDWMLPYLGNLLNDEYRAVRFIAARSLRDAHGRADPEYDFLAPTTVRREAIRRLLSDWGDLPDKRIGAELLIDGAGRLHRAKVQQLLSQRNHRPVILKE